METHPFVDKNVIAKKNAEMSKEEKTEQEIRLMQRNLTKAEQDTAQAQQTVQQQNQEIDRLRTQVQNLQLQTANTVQPGPSAQNEHAARDFSASQQKAIPAFKGGYSPTFTEWIIRFEEICKAFRWQDDRRAEILPIYLENTALETYRRLPDETKTSYATLKTELSKILEPVESDTFCAALLYKPRKQNIDEEVAVYAADIERLVRGAHPITDEFPRQAQTKIMRNVFIAGLQGTEKDGIKGKVLDKEPATYQKALEAALKAEAHLRILQGSNPKTEQAANVDTQNFQIFGVNAQSWQNNRNRFDTNTQNLYRTVGPYRGSSPQFYRSNRRRPFGRGSFFARPYQYQNQIPQQNFKWCNFCKINGHTYAECRTKFRYQNTVPDNSQFRGQSFRRTQGRTRNWRGQRRGAPQMQRTQYYRTNAIFPSEESQSFEASSQNTPSAETQFENEYRRAIISLAQQNQAQNQTMHCAEGQNNQMPHSSQTLFHDETSPVTFYMFTGSCPHNESEWENIPQSCKEKLCCEYNHQIYIEVGRRTTCCHLGCPSLETCGVCIHGRYCQNCNDMQDYENFTPDSGLEQAQIQSNEQQGKNKNLCVEQTPEFQSCQDYVEEALEVKKLSSFAYLPYRETKGSVGYDLFSPYTYHIPARGTKACLTDLAVTPPKGSFAQIISCSKLAAECSIEVGASVIDTDYSGNVTVLLHNHSDQDHTIERGQKLAQLVCQKFSLPKVVETSKIRSTPRGLHGMLDVLPHPSESKGKKHSTDYSSDSEDKLTKKQILERTYSETTLMHFKQTVPLRNWSRRWSTSSLITFTLLLFIVSGVSKTEGQFATPPFETDYFICGQSRSGYAYALPKEIVCKPPRLDVDRIENVKVELWVPKTHPSFTDGYKCYIKTRTVCTYTGLFGMKSKISDDYVIKNVSIADCKEAAHNHIFSGKSLTPIESGIWTTNGKLIIHYKWCCYSVCQTVTNFIVEKGQVATVNGNELISDLGDIGSCNALSQGCTVDMQTIIWDPYEINEICDFELKGTYSAISSGFHIIIDEIQGAFSYTPQGIREGQRPGKPTCLPSYIHMMDQQVAVGFLDKQFEPEWWKNFTLDHINNKHLIELEDPQNAKLQYLAYKLIQAEQRDFRTVWIALCNLAQRQLQLTWQILRIDPTLGARAFLGREDITASFAGEALMVWQCKKVTPTKFYWDYRVKNKCFEYIPVDIGKKRMFIVPGSKDLIQSSLSVPCEHHLSGIYKTTIYDTDGTLSWKTSNGFVHVKQLPIELSWKNLWKPFVFNSPVVYHNKLAGLSTTVSMLRSYFRHAFILENKISGLINITADMSLDPRTIRQAFAGIGDSVGGAFTGVGIGIEHVISGIGQGTGHLVSGILEGPLQGFLNFVIISSLILLAIAILYFSIRYWVWPRLKNNKRIQERVRNFNPQAWYQRFKRRINGKRDPNPFRPSQFISENETQHTQEHSEQIEMHQCQPSSSLNTDNEDNESTFVEVHETPESDTKVPGTEWPIAIATISGIGNCPVTRLHFGHVGINALVDTGSALTLINDNILSLIRNSQTVVVDSSNSEIKPVSASGHTIEIKGRAYLTFGIGRHEYTHLFQIVSTLHNATQQCIIGMDLLQKIGPFTLDTQKGKIHFPNNTIKLQGEKSKQSEIVKLSKTVKIQPRTAIVTFVQVKFDSPEPLLFELTDHNRLPYGLTAFNTLAYSEDKQMPVCLVNSTEAPITVFKKKKIGIASVPEPMSMANATTCENGSNASSPNKDQIAKTINDISLENTDLTFQQKAKLKQLLIENQDIFALSDIDLGRTHLLEHRIDTKDHPPISQKPYPVPHALRNIIKEHVDKMLKQGVIRPSFSPWASPVVLVKKKEGTLRFCIDFRKLNAITVKDTYPLPRIDDILTTLNKTRYYTSLDLQSGYWQVPVHKNDISKTAFITFGGLWEFITLPFGLCNAPSLFQRLMERVLSGLLWKFAFVYIDDILCCSTTFDEHVSHLKQIFNRLRAANLKLKISKCHFAQKQISFLGHTVSQQGIAVDPSKTDKIMKFPQPTTITELKRFLGLCSYYRRFVQNFSKIAQPLNALLRKNTNFIWSNDCENSFKTLKTHLVTPPVLRYPDFKKDFIVQTDASGKALGAVLSQIYEDGEHPIAFASRTLNTAESKYPAIELEALAVVFAIKRFRPYVYGHKITIQTDHAPLKWLLSTATSPDGSSKIQRWALTLQEYDFVVQHRPGKCNANADALSRVNITSLQSDDFPHTALSNEVNSPMQQQQRNDPELNVILNFLKHNVLPENDNLAREIALTCPRYSIIDGILYYSDPKQRTIFQLVIPKSMQIEILESMHANLFAGHFGFHRTITKLRQYYFWKTMIKDARDFCLRCAECQFRKSPSQKARMPLKPLPAVSLPWDRVAVDILGPINPPSQLGHRYIIIFTDYLTRWVEAYPLVDIKANTVARIFVEGIICRFGSPSQLLSDRASNFLSKVMYEVCKILQTKKINSTSFHPQTDGLVERFNRTLITCLSIYMKQKNDWHVFLPYILFAYRTSPHASTKESPYYLLFGRDPKLPTAEKLSEPPSPYVCDLDSYAHVLHRYLHDAWTLAKHNLVQAQEQQKAYYDKKTHIYEYKEGDKVLLHNPVVPLGTSPKFHKPWENIWRIISLKNFPVVELQKIADPGYHTRAHANRLKPFFESAPKNIEVQSKPFDPQVTLDSQKPRHDYYLRSTKQKQ